MINASPDGILKIIGDASEQHEAMTLETPTACYLGAKEAQLLYDYFFKQNWITGNEVTAKRLLKMIVHSYSCEWPRPCNHGVLDRWPVAKFKDGKEVAPEEKFILLEKSIIIVRQKQLLLLT